MAPQALRFGLAMPSVTADRPREKLRHVTPLLLVSVPDLDVVADPAPRPPPESEQDQRQRLVEPDGQVGAWWSASSSTYGTPWIAARRRATVDLPFPLAPRTAIRAGLEVVIAE
jgi:hypothetical protein